MQSSKQLNRNFLISTIQPLCESTLRSSSSRPLLWVRGFFILVRTKLSALSMTTIVHAGKAAAAGLDALLLSICAKSNQRIFVGLGLLGVAAPLVSCFYMLFDRSAVDETWYHVGYYYLFLVIAPPMFLLTCLIGVWFLFPQGSRRAYALIVPAGFTIGKILWLIQCTSNEDFYSVVPFSFVLIGALIALFLFVALDWLAHRKFHREDAFQARMDKLCELADDFDDAKFKSMVKSVWRDKQSFKKQF